MINKSEFVKNCTNMALSFYRKPETSGLSMFFSESKDPSKNALWVLGMCDDEEKHFTYNLLSSCMQTRGADRYAVMTRAWMTRQADKKPSNAPDRELVLIVAIADKSEAASATIFPLEIDECGNVLAIKEAEPRPIVMAGAMFDFLYREISELDEIAPLAEEYLSDFIVHGRLDTQYYAMLN